MRKHATLKELSEHVKLTPGTVSRALNDKYTDISSKTRKRVKEAAVTLGYRPNHSAKNLATGMPTSVAYVMPGGDGLSAGPFIAHLLTGLGQALSKRGWDLMITTPADGECEQDMLFRHITSGRISGVVISRPYVDDPRIQLLQDADFPFVVHGRSRGHENYAWYDIDSRKAFSEAVGHLVGLGHERIGFIGGPSRYCLSQDRLSGYRDGLSRKKIPFDRALVRESDLDDASAASAARKLLGLANAPTALLCATDTQAIGALSAIGKYGLRPGYDVSVIGYDGLPFGNHTHPPLTTMEQPKLRSGYRIGEMVLALVDGQSPKDLQELHEAKLLLRESDGPARQSSSYQYREESQFPAVSV